MKDYGYNQLNQSNLSLVRIHGSGFALNVRDAYNQETLSAMHNFMYLSFASSRVCIF